MVPRHEESKSETENQTAGASPYVTGGGGFTLERRIASIYLAHMLRGSTAAEIYGRKIVSVSLQATGELIDDVVVRAAREDENETSLVLCIAARRTPKFVTSDDKTRKLLQKFIQAIAVPTEDGVEREFAIAVAGVQNAPDQVADLANFARKRPQTEFYELISSDGAVSQALRDRLVHFKGLIKRALGAPDIEVEESAVDATTWNLLSKLSIISYRVEAPAQHDWAELTNTLIQWSRIGGLSGGQALRDRLEILAGEYAASSGTVDAKMLRRDLHDHLTQASEKRHPGWAALLDAQRESLALIRPEMGGVPGGQSLHLPRTKLTRKLRGYLSQSENALVHGVSGSGKSALVVSAITAELQEQPSGLERVYLDLRRLPPTAIELRAALGASLEVLLSQVSAPARYLVVDNAGWLSEGGQSLLPWVLSAAQSAGLNVIAVTTTETAASVRTVLGNAHIKADSLEVPLLDDSELQSVGHHFPKLLGLVSNARSKDILRRPMVAHLLAQSGTEVTSLSEVDALNEVWDKIVLGNGDPARGTPRAREEVLLRLAHLSLAPQSGVLHTLDPTALFGLERDGLLHRGTGLPWDPSGQATFFHDQIRLFAISKILMQSQNPVDVLLQTGAQRWTLPAARIAVQAILSAAATPSAPSEGRLQLLQSQFQALADAGHGERWTDVPVEAALPLSTAREIFGDAWDHLLQDDARNLRQVLRVIEQRHTPDIKVDPLVAEPIVDLLLEREWPYGVEKDVRTLKRRWLSALVLNETPVGNPLRQKIRADLQTKIEEEEKALESKKKAEQDSREAMSREELDADHKVNSMAELGFYTPAQRRRRARRLELPRILRDDHSIETLALLGKDLSDFGKSVLLQVAEHCPSDLRAALEEFPAATAVAQYDPKLLTRLTAAYYIDASADPDDPDGSWGFRDEGIRHHRSRGHWGPPFNAFHMGSFLPMLRHDFVGGVGVINKMLDHAAKCRVRTLRRTDDISTDSEGHGLSLTLTQTERFFTGDSHVWSWYRGTSVGPYPCMSALQALEFVCDDHLRRSSFEIERLVPFLLKDCNNLAMPALVLGVLIRHLEEAGEAIDPFFSEPKVWDLELSRALHERVGYAASTPGITAPARRIWGLREAATQLAIHSDAAAESRLDSVANRLIDRAKQLHGYSDPVAAQDGKPQWLALVEKDAGLLRKAQYRLVRQSDGVYLEQQLPEDVEKSLNATNTELERGFKTVGMTSRHVHSIYQPGPDKQAMTLQVLREDIASAQDLLQDPPPTAVGLIDACTGVAASALNCHYLGIATLSADELLWAAQIVLEAVELYDEGPDERYENSYFYQGADRSAARSVAILTLPEAEGLRDALTLVGFGQDAIPNANRWAATRSCRESRLIYARSLDIVWSTEGPANYWSAMLALVEDSARDAVIGVWDASGQSRERETLLGPVDVALSAVPSERVIVQDLIPAIRGLARATQLPGLDGDRARVLLAALMEAYRKGRLQEDGGDLHSGSDMLNVVRALLPLVEAGSTDLLWQQLDEYVSQSDLLAEFLRALAAAGEETEHGASIVRSVWPQVMDRVLNLAEQQSLPAGDGSFPHSGLASLIPNRAYEGQYLYREAGRTPVLWWDALSLRPQIERWLTMASGKHECVDRLVALVAILDERFQVKPGLEWVEQLVVPDASGISQRSHLLPEWLAKVGGYSSLSNQPGCRDAWQRIIDALHVAGETRLGELDD